MTLAFCEIARAAKRQHPATMQPGPIPTLGDLQRATPWVWLWCERCQHHTPLACAVAVIRWGAGTSSDRLRQRARCSSCGSKGATIQHPGWGGNDVGFVPLVAERHADLNVLGTSYSSGSFGWANELVQVDLDAQFLRLIG
jgi:hypothetical protein